MLFLSSSCKFLTQDVSKQVLSEIKGGFLMTVFTNQLHHLTNCPSSHTEKLDHIRELLEWISKEEFMHSLCFSQQCYLKDPNTTGWEIILTIFQQYSNIVTRWWPQHYDRYPLQFSSFLIFWLKLWKKLIHILNKISSQLPTFLSLGAILSLELS